VRKNDAVAGRTGKDQCKMNWRDKKLNWEQNIGSEAT